MISNTELAVILTMIPYTLMIVIGIHKYEAKLKKIKAPSNAEHYTQLQLDNYSLRKTVTDLDVANKLLQQQIRQLKESLLESRPIQYESSVYQNQILPIEMRDYELKAYNEKRKNGDDGFLVEL